MSNMWVMLISGSGIGNLTSYAEEVTDVGVQEDIPVETEEITDDSEEIIW